VRTLWKKSGENLSSYRAQGRLSSIVFPGHLYNFDAGLEGAARSAPTLHPQVIDETYILLLCQCVYEHLLYALFASGL
jgi:hypothetical protein